MRYPLPGQFEFFNTIEAPRKKTCNRCKKILEVKDFYKNGDGYFNYCIECHKRGTQKNVRIRISDKIGFLTHVYKRLKEKRVSKKTKALPAKHQARYDVKVTLEEFIELWEEHEKVYGFHCRLSGQKIAFIRANKGQGPGGSYSNTMSPDRLDPHRCYEKKNIIFVANEVNIRKKDVTYKDCKKIVEIYEERFRDEF